MDKKTYEEKVAKLNEEIKVLEKRVEKTLAKSDEAFNLGGDGWHDNSAYHLMIADIDKLGSMIDEIKQEIRELVRAYKPAKNK